nr:probable phospholipid-transporting ATPase 8 isoform X2 [Ziziphus jujuba var. spinosa]
MPERRKKRIHFSKLCSFSCIRSLYEDSRAQIGQKGYSRVVYCNDPDNPEQVQLRYRGNYVSTTKYTVVNFIPKSLFEQLMRVANLYFLVVACVSFSPLAPYNAVSVLAILSVLIGATMTKEAVEDWRRRKQYIEANNRKVKVYSRNHMFHETRWKNLRVGDIVKVCRDEYFPADLLLLSSSHEDSICYVETMNLDGEINLKLKHALEVTSHLHEEKSFNDFMAVIRCEEPNENLHSFGGDLYHGETWYPLSLQQILLRESKLRNTGYIYGVVVFTGHDTKVMQNATHPPSKKSKIERRMDKIFYVLCSAMILISFIGSVFFGIETKEDLNHGKFRRWYLRPDDTPVFYNPKRATLAAFLHFLTAPMLYGYLIPISLYVSIEMVKVLQSIFIDHDQDMYYEETDKPAYARTSNLNEELGLVEMILSDKTGTLTSNSMEFVKCSIAGTAYGRGMTEVEVALARRRTDGPTDDIPSDRLSHDADTRGSEKTVKGFNFIDERINNSQWVNEPHCDVIQKFFRVLAICHTVIPDKSKGLGEISYEAESPDEAAFVIAARELGFEFFGRTQTSISLNEFDFKTGKRVDRVYQLLHVLEFSSSRKRMSVIVRNPENQLLLLCKGADSVMFERLAKDGRAFEVQTKDHINNYAEAGLRTLVIAYRELSEEENKKWEEEFPKAKTSVTLGRDALVDAAADKIERDMILLGATAVEEKLQKGVTECINNLTRVGIKIWVLTGDKMENAVSIGYACSLLRQDMKQIIITLDSPDIIALEKQGDKEAVAKASLDSIKKQLREGISQIQSAKESSSSVNKGSIAFGLLIDGKSLEFSLKKNFRKTFFELAVNCASVICCRCTPKQKACVTRLVKLETGKTTLSIGDGANDVGMLQEADIGVGISGEGMQICYFFYKNMTFGLTLFWYDAYTSFSGQPAYNDWNMSFYNIFFTSLPVIALGVLNQGVSARLCLKYPLFYREGLENIFFSWPRILGWMINGVISSIIIFFFTTNSLINQAFQRDGKVVDFEVLGVTMYTCVVWAVNCQLVLAVDYFTWIQQFLMWGSIALWYIFLVVYGSLSPSESTTAYKVFVEACAPSALYWLVTLLVVICTLIPYFSFRAFQTRFSPTYHEIIQQVEEALKDTYSELPLAVRGKLQPLRERLNNKRDP